MITSTKYIKPVISSAFRLNQRSFWGWINATFNKVDKSRIQAVGPDRACAEWLLRCGASVKWKGMDNFLNDYNSLPPENIKFYIKEIDATDSGVMHIGFPHLRGLKHLDRMILHNCVYIEDAAIEMLSYSKNTLRQLQISRCGNVTLDGLKSLQQLKKLETLLLYDFPEVRNKDECVKFLSEKLPQCNIEFPYALASEIK